MIIQQLIKVLFMSMIPVFELRLSLPVSFVSLTGDAINMAPIPAIAISYLITVIGNLIPVPILLIFGNKVLNFFASLTEYQGKCGGFLRNCIGKPCAWIRKKGEKNAQKVKPAALFWSLLCFVAIPLPGTGAWTGCLVSMVLNIKFKKAILPIISGVCIAGLIVSGIVLLIKFAPDMFSWLGWFVGK